MQRRTHTSRACWMWFKVTQAFFFNLVFFPLGEHRYVTSFHGLLTLSQHTYHALQLRKGQIMSSSPYHSEPAQKQELLSKNIRGCTCMVEVPSMLLCMYMVHVSPQQVFVCLGQDFVFLIDPIFYLAVCWRTQKYKKTFF